MLKLFANGGYVPVQVGKFPAGEVYVKVDNGDNSVYGINPVEFWKTHERVVE